MATSVTAGWEGTVTYTGITYRAQVVGVEEVIDVNDCSGLGTQQRQNLEGMKVLRISVAGSALRDSTSGFTVTGIGQVRTNTGATYTFIPANGSTSAGFTANAIASNIRYGKDINGNDAIGFQLVTSGVYTVA